MDRVQAFGRVTAATSKLQDLLCDIEDDRSFTGISITQAVEEAFDAAVALAAFPDRTHTEVVALTTLKLTIPHLILDAMDRAQHGLLRS